MKKLSLFISMLLLAGCGTADFLGLYTGFAQDNSTQRQVQLQVVSDNGDSLSGTISANGVSATQFTGTASGDQMSITVFNNSGAISSNCFGILSGTLTLNGTQLTGTLVCNGNTGGGQTGQGSVFLNLQRVSGN